MSAKDRPPMTRFLALAALILAAGLFAFRAYDVFNTPTSEPVGSTLEREITYLLEPITGAERVRVAVTMGSPKTVLVMIDGESGSDLRALRTQIERVLTASMGFNVEADTLTLSQFPFATGLNGAPTPLETAELSGFGLLVLLLLGVSLNPQRARANAVPIANAPRPEALVAPRVPAAMPQPSLPAPNELSSATQLAEAKPVETAGLVRGWMSYAED